MSDTERALQQSSNGRNGMNDIEQTLEFYRVGVRALLSNPDYTDGDWRDALTHSNNAVIALEFYKDYNADCSTCANDGDEICNDCKGLAYTLANHYEPKEGKSK